MIYRNVGSFRIGRALVSVGLFTIGLVASMAVPGLAQTSGTWTTTNTLRIPRTGHTATTLQNGQVLVVGGHDMAGNILSSAELYNPTTRMWTITGSMATPRISHSATLLPNGEVLVAGGLINQFTCNFNNCVTYTESAELYNPATGRWRHTANMSTPRSSHGVALLQNGQVLVAGGIQNFEGQPVYSPVWLSSAELYDPAKGAWSPTGSMNDLHAVPATLLKNGQVLVAEQQSGADLYHPSTGKWTLTAPMVNSGHTGISTASLPNGNVLLYGNHFPSYAGEYYNPSTNIWTNTKYQNTGAISGGPLMLLANGKVLLAGGAMKYGGMSPVCMIYDPPTNAWSFTGTLIKAGFHILARLLNGQVLAVGGNDAELYAP